MRHVQHDAFRRDSLVTETLGMDIDPDHGSVRWRGQPKEAAARRSCNRPGNRSAGCRAANGAGMLLHQGTRALELWTGRPAPVNVMRAALEKNLYG